MVNTANQSVVKAILSDAEFLFLIKATGITPGKLSPLGRISGVPVSAVNKTLQQSGLLGSDNRPTTECVECFQILANPDTEIDLLWGNSDGINLSNVYSSGGKDRLVSYTRSGSNNHLSCFLSSSDLNDLIISKTAFPEIKEEVPFSIENNENVIPVFLALLDLYRESQLKSALERRTDTKLDVSADAITRLIETSKTDLDFNWLTAAGFVALPGSFNGSINDGLNALKKTGYLASDNTPNQNITLFASHTFPLISFVGVRTLTNKNANLEKTQFALFRGLSALLLFQITQENGARQTIINSISTSHLPELLHTLSTRPFEVPSAVSQQVPAGDAVCGKCGFANKPQSKFCEKCGTPMAQQPKDKFCPKCGDQIKPGEKFCDKCGAKLN